MRQVLAIAVFVCFCPAARPGGDEAEGVKKAVLGPQEAGWARHDFKTYMTQWARDARIVISREEKPGKHDVILDRKQIEATRRLLLHGTPPANKKVVFEDVKVTVKGNDAELRVRTTISEGKDYETAAEVYQVRKTSAGWKVSLNRGWPVKEKFGDQEKTFNAAKWKELDEIADDMVGKDKRGDRAAGALMTAFRFKEAHDLLKKVTARKDASAADWILRGNAAVAAGHADDALASHRRALKLDAEAPVPPYARELAKE
jgi:hypothetical protein